MLHFADIKQAALTVGFNDCGVARADCLGDDEYPLRHWLALGWHADLSYMERNVEMRMDPRLLVNGARTVICCVSAYPPPSSHGGVAAYARHREYHKEIKDMLYRLRQQLGIDGKVCCDTVPISDKHWAARAGLGVIGRHTLLITPRWGTWVNLGEIVTTESCDLYSRPQYPSVLSSVCKRCHRCVDSCPNAAIAPDGPPMINVARCTAYYTTHHPKPMPPGINAHGYTLGCDICQLACPHNASLTSTKPTPPTPSVTL